MKAKLFCLVPLTALLLSVVRAQSSLSIGLSGFSGDIILGATETEGSGTNTQEDGWIFYGTGATATEGALTQGLPTSGSFVSAANSNVGFQFAPYTSNNVLTGDGTLTLATPGSFQDLSFLATAQGGGSFTVTLNFSNSTTATTATFTPLDWTAGTEGGSDGSNALDNSGLVGHGTVYTGGLFLKEFDYAVPAEDESLTLDSITISAPGNVMFFAASGISAIPEPSTYAAIFGLLALGAAGVREFRRRRAIPA
jgi:hypothetical protein